VTCRLYNIPADFVEILRKSSSTSIRDAGAKP
jgi:hypothetical protein